MAQRHFPMAGTGKFAALVMAGLLAAAIPAGAGPLPIKNAGVEDILSSQVQEPTVYSLDGNPGIFVIDIPTLEQQGEMFNRVVALIEKLEGPRDRVFTNAELAEHIRSTGRTPATFAFGNDFRATELAVFFNLADFGQVSLNPVEETLRSFMLEQGMLKNRFGFMQVNPPNRVILSVPQIQATAADRKIGVTPMARETILRHELSHGEYYTNELYANYCRRFWKSILTEAERNAFKGFLGKQHYDVSNEELMINETQAYLMHTPDPKAFSSKVLGLDDAAINDMRKRFVAGNPPGALFAQR